MATLQKTLGSLVVPSTFARHDRITEASVLAGLYAWKSNTGPLLNQLESLDFTTLSTFEQADLVCTLTPLTAVAQWSSLETRSLASGIPVVSRAISSLTVATAGLARIPVSNQLITDILSQFVKPLFAPTPHPRLHTSTARILSRPADVQDTYFEQPWKEHLGLDEIIRWCLLNTESSAYETAWPLFLPPLMTFLDDYQVSYKLLGTRLVFDMLTRVPPDLLLRTGVDSLMFTSLTNSLSHLGDQSNSDFIRLAITTTLKLVDLTTPSLLPSHVLSLRVNEPQCKPATVPTHTLSSSQSKSLATRFSRLSTLLSSSLLGTVIMYTPTFLPPIPSPVTDSAPFADPERAGTNPVHVPETLLRTPMPRKQSFNPTLVTAAQILAPVLLALGIGAARFLKGIIPVLAEWLGLAITAEAGSVSDDNSGTSPYGMERSSRHGSESFVLDVTLHLASLSSLSVLLHTCTPLMKGWSTTIIDALGRCWVGCLDVENQRGDDTSSKGSLCALKRQLKEVAVQLAEVNPSVVKNEYATLMAFNKDLFEGLVGEIW